MAILLRLKANQAIFKCSLVNINQSACELGKWLEINSFMLIVYSSCSLF